MNKKIVINSIINVNEFNISIELIKNGLNDELINNLNKRLNIFNNLYYSGQNQINCIDSDNYEKSN